MEVEVTCYRTKRGPPSQIWNNSESTLAFQGSRNHFVWWGVFIFLFLKIYLKKFLIKLILF